MTGTQTMDKLLQDLEKHQTTLKHRDLRQGLTEGRTSVDTMYGPGSTITRHGRSYKLLVTPEKFREGELERLKKGPKTKHHAGYIAGLAKGLISRGVYQPAIELLGESGLIHSKSMTQYLRKGLERGVEQQRIGSKELSQMETKIKQYTRT